jgi:hypothetical protein
MLYQGFFYGILGTDLAHTSHYSGAFPLLISRFNISDSFRNFLGHFIHLSIAISALSAAFGIIYANIWNLYTLAEQHHTIAPVAIMQRNRFNIPFMCVVAQGAIMLTYMFIMCEQTTFQQLSAFGTTMTYAMSIAGLCATLYKKGNSIVLPIMGFINCAILMSASLIAMWKTNNPIPLYIFVGIIIFGILMYGMSQQQKQG